MHAIHHLSDIAQNLVRGNSDHSVSNPLEVSRSRRVVSLRRGVLIPIDLDDEPRLEAEKIGDVRPERHLSSELESAQTPIARAAPEFPRGIAGRSARPAHPIKWSDGNRFADGCAARSRAMFPGDTLLLRLMHIRTLREL